MNTLEIIGRSKQLFRDDILSMENDLFEIIRKSRILVVGAAGSIGQAVTLELFKRQPKALHAIDLSENNLVELVRIIRSTIGYNNCDFRTFAIDCSSKEFEILANEERNYDFIFNLSALKHVRSERDPYTLMRLVDVNIFNSIKLMELAKKHSAKNYFCVSTDKATNPVNMMGASKRIMEKFLFKESSNQNVSLSRFANVAFSDGSLLHGFTKRFKKKQPISAPNDVRRYFITHQESGQLCMLSGIFGKNNEIYFPKLDEDLYLETFSNIAIRFLESKGFEPHECSSEDEARSSFSKLFEKKKWPVYFFKSDTTGEKEYEEFYTRKDTIDMKRYNDIGIILNEPSINIEKLKAFTEEINKIKQNISWSKSDIIDAFKSVVPEFVHKDKGKHLDNKM